MHLVEVNPLILARTEAKFRRAFDGVDAVAAPMRSSMCFCPGSSVAAYTMSTQAWSMAIGSSDAMMPMSAMQGFSATAQQSQSTDRFFITLM